MSDQVDRLLRIRQLFDHAIDLPAAERQVYVESVTADDLEMRRDLLDLLGDDSGTSELLPSPVLDVQRTARDLPQDLVGQHLGSYNIVSLIGTGGMGAVYEGTRADDQYRKRVAIKLVQGGLASEVTLARFRRERQILATLEHRNIATLLDGGVSPDGRPFLVMEYVEGEPITLWCDKRNLSIHDRVMLFRQVCAAVQHAHRNLVVHRDLKPGNIFVSSDGTVKLLDFGIAQLVDGDEDLMPLTRGGMRPFTPEYASPEQIRGDVLTTASDIYSLGVVLFELLAGRRPHVPASRALVDIERSVLTDPIPLPSAVVTADTAGRRGGNSVDRIRRELHGELDNIVRKALRPEPERRYLSVDALSEDLQRYLTGQPISAQRDWAGYRIKKFVQRNIAATAASALVVIALIGGVITTTIQARRAREHQLTAERQNAFLRDLLSSVKPVTGGRDVTVSEILDSAAGRLKSELAGEPEVRAELEDVVGHSFIALGRYDEAEKHFNEELALRRQLDGPESPAVVQVLTSLGDLFSIASELPKADSMLHRALDMHNKLALKPDTTLGVIYSNMGSVAHLSGEPAESEKWHRRALAIAEEVAGPKSDKVAFQLNDIGVALGEQGKWAEAEPLHRQSLAILTANHPEPNVNVANGYNALATAYDIEGKTVEADSIYRLTLAMRKQLLGTDHPDYNFTLFNYSIFMFDQKHYAESMEMAQEVLSNRGKSIAESNPAIPVALQTVGRSLDRLGRTEEGGKALQESLDLRRKNLPPGSWLVASSEGYLGEHETLIGDYADAERLLLHADSIIRSHLGPLHPNTMKNYVRLVALYDAWGKPEAAAAYRAKITVKPAN